MDNTNNTPIDYRLSSKIFNILTKGQIINKTIYDKNKNEVVDNILFQEIIRNLDKYKEQYKRCGMELSFNGNYCYLMENVKDKEPIKTKIYVGIILLVRFSSHYISKNKTYIFDHNYGIKREDLKELSEIEDFKNIIKASQFSNIEAVVDLLCDRNILEENADGRYFLTDAGKAIVNDIIASEKNN